ncbi:MAG TPA: ABC transporter permease [Methanophagales archaeon]|nr:ABC transporter permease [Methanophagales archaeon]
MEAKGLFNVAKKEFIGHLTSKKFIVILGLFLIISALAMHQGIDNYNERLDAYKEQLSQIKEVEGPVGWMPEKPSIMLVFMFMSRYILMLGAILAIAMGFDLLSKEKETRSLKSLLSCPVFRDEIINGKALGGTLALVFAMGTALLISLAILLIFSIVPSMNELAAILVFGIVSIVFLLAYFAIALMMSTVSRDSGSALIYTLVIFFILGSLLPIVGSTVADMVSGDLPEPPAFDIPYETNESEGHIYNWEGTNEEMQQYQEESRAWSEKRKPITEAFNIISPNMNYQKISFLISNPQIYSVVYEQSSPLTSTGYSTFGGETALGLQEVLGRVWKNILALISFSVVFFAIAYIRFMRLDIR